MASSKREKELARQRAERQAARRATAAQRRKQRNAVVASVAAVAVVAVSAVGLAMSLSDDDSDTATAAPAASTDASPAAQTRPGTCAYPKSSEAAAKKVELPPTEGIETKQVYEVTVATNRGNVVFDMDSSKAPCTANSLRSLAQRAYFDGTPCHRLTTEGISVLQCGDPSGTGGGGPGYEFADENLKGATYRRGTVAMANAGAGTNGSQFFLVFKDSTLPPNYTPFGTITAGLDVLEKIAKGGSDESKATGDGKPKIAVQIATLRVKPKAA